MNPKGHAALVTGGGSGLGAATAAALAKAGAKVALLDVNENAMKEVAAKIGAIAVKCDVSDADAAAKAVAEARAQHGAARILVNCAGIGPAKRVVGRDGPMPLADFERGVIVSTASVAAYEGQIGQAAYAASKGGVVSLTLPAARELAQSGIRVNAIAPGIFLTPMLMGLPEEGRQGAAAAGRLSPRVARRGANEA